MLHAKRAVTLPETLVTIAILASVILYFILAFTVGKYATQLSKNRLIVSNLLREELEKMLGSNYSELEGFVGTQDLSIDDGSKIILAEKTVKLAVEDPDLYGYVKIYAKIEWTGGLAGNKTLKEELVLYVTKE